MERIDFALPRMSVIAGRVTDELGEPIENTLVLVLRSMSFNGERRLVPTGQIARTDDGGNYRQSGLVPGTYLIQARTNEKWIVESNGVQETLGYIPTFYPGVDGSAAAQKVTVGVGKEVPAVDFSLIAGKAAKVSGTAVDSLGRPFKRVGLSQEIRGDNFASFASAGDSVVAPDGTFVIPTVAPGEYKLSASTMDANGPDDDPEVAVMTIFVAGSDLEGLSLVGSSGGTITGQLATDNSTALPTNVRITVASTVTDTTRNSVFRASGGSGIGTIAADGTFTVAHVFGPARFVVTPPDGWTVKTIVLDGEDITDVPVEMRSGEERSGVQVTLTNRLSVVTGQLTNEKGVPIDGTMIVFAADSSKWFDGSRFIKAARPDQAGRAQLKGLPPGEYLAVAVDYIEDGAWQERDYLESMREHASKITVSEGATETVTLKVVPPRP